MGRGGSGGILGEDGEGGVEIASVATKPCRERAIDDATLGASDIAATRMVDRRFVTTAGDRVIFANVY
jgi:hypothetical protein